jgi:hypothetical protein
MSDQFSTFELNAQQQQIEGNSSQLLLLNSKIELHSMRGTILRSGNRSWPVLHRDKPVAVVHHPIRRIREDVAWPPDRTRPSNTRVQGSLARRLRIRPVGLGTERQHWAKLPPSRSSSSACIHRRVLAELRLCCTPCHRSCSV